MKPGSKRQNPGSRTSIFIIGRLVRLSLSDARIAGLIMIRARVYVGAD